MVVVGHAHELDERLSCVEPLRLDDGVAHTPIAVLGSPAAAHIDEGRAGDLADVGDVRVAEDDGLVWVGLGEAGKDATNAGDKKGAPAGDKKAEAKPEAKKK